MSMSNKYVTQGTVGWEGPGPEKWYDECRPQDPGGESSHQDPGGVYPPHFHQTKPKGCLTSFFFLSLPSSFISIKSQNVPPLLFRTSQILHFFVALVTFQFSQMRCILVFAVPWNIFQRRLVIHWLFRSAELTLISQKRWRQSKTLRLGFCCWPHFTQTFKMLLRRGMRPNSRYLCVFV